jgi:hypothetical protein
MKTEGKNPLPKENVFTHLDKITPYLMQVSEWAGQVTRWELLSPAATDRGHGRQVRRQYRYPRLYIKGSR